VVSFWYPRFRSWPLANNEARFLAKVAANVDINDIYMGTIFIFVSDKYPYCVLLY